MAIAVAADAAGAAAVAPLPGEPPDLLPVVADPSGVGAAPVTGAPALPEAALPWESAL